MRNIGVAVACLGLIAVVAAGCASPEVATEQQAPPMSPYSENFAAGDQASTHFGSSQDGGATAQSVATTALPDLAASESPDRYLIKNATLRIESEDPRNAASNISQSAVDAGGYVAELRESRDALGQMEVRMTIRVPKTKLEDTLDGIESLGRLHHRQVTTEDVTEDYIDTDARVRNLKRTEERMLEHFERAGDLEQIVTVERELSRVREEIERAEGRLRYLSHRVAFSTVNITVEQKPRGQSVVPAEAFSTAKEFSDALRALITFGQGVWLRVIWLGVWAVVWVPIAVVTIWGVRWYKRSKRQAGET